MELEIEFDLYANAKKLYVERLQNWRGYEFGGVVDIDGKEHIFIRFIPDSILQMIVDMDDQKCLWFPSQYYNFWRTTCGKLLDKVTFPVFDHFKFCPCCGKKIVFETELEKLSSGSTS